MLEAKRITRRREELEEKIKGLYNEQKSEHSKETIESESLDIDQSNVSDTNVPVTSEILSESLNKARELSVLKL